MWGAITGALGGVASIFGGAKKSSAAKVAFQNQIAAQNRIINEMKAEAAKKSKTTMFIIFGLIAAAILTFIIIKRKK